MKKAADAAFFTDQPACFWMQLRKSKHQRPVLCIFDLDDRFTQASS